MSDALKGQAGELVGKKEERHGEPLETLNFKVTAAFKKDFKGYAVGQGVTMVELLKEGFALTKKMRNRS